MNLIKKIKLHKRGVISTESNERRSLLKRSLGFSRDDKFRLHPLTLYILFPILVVSCFFLPKSFAEDMTTSFSVSPVIVETKLNPGQSKKFQLTVYNKSAQPQIIQMYTQNFEASNETGDLKFTEESNETFAAKDWLKFSASQVVLEPKKSKNVSFDLDIPETAEPGGHYVTIFFESVNPPSDNAGSGVEISGRIGALLFVTVNGQILEKGRVLGVTSDDKCEGVACSFKTAKFRNWGPVPFEFKFENTGNVHVKVSGKVEIFNLFGQKVGEVPVDEKTVLPKSTRHFQQTWLREPLFGYYSAKLTIYYGSLNVTDHARVAFWAFPWKVILPLVILALLSWILIIKKTRFKFSLNKFGLQKLKRRKILDKQKS
jgi:hypothetical protein